MKRKTKNTQQSGFTFVELTIGAVLTGVLLLGAYGIQKAAVESFRRSEIASQPMDEISRIGDRLDRELRRAASGTLEVEVPGSPFPSPPVSGTEYESISFRRVLFDPSAAQGGTTVQDASVCTLAKNGNALEWTSGATTQEIARDVTDFSVVWNGGTRALTLTLQIRKSFPDGQSVTKTLTRNILLRNV